MSDEYQLRKDVDRLIDDIYGVNSRIVAFADDSQLRGIFTDEFNTGTIDALFEYYDLYNHEGGGGGDLSNYYTKTEIDGILSSYVTNQTLEDYALKSELFSGSYEDLTDVPSSFPPSTHTHNWDSVTGKPSTFPPSSHNHDDRYYTESEVDTALNSKQDNLVSGTNIKTLNNESLLGSGNIDFPQNVFYGTCSTSASTQTKVITVDDWSFTTGNIIFVYFQNGNSYNGTAKLSIDNTVKNITSVGSNETSRYYWKSGEMVGFVYDGNNMVMLEGGTATTSYYGVTKLSSSTSSTSETVSATPKAVKTAYDLANGKADSVHTHTVSDVTDFPILSDVATSGEYSDLENIPSTFLPSTHSHNGTELILDSTYIWNLDIGVGIPNAQNFLNAIDSAIGHKADSEHNHDDRYYTESEIDTALNGKQATLVSGTNIKTINNQSLLGSGNIDIQGGGGSVIGTGSFSINNQGHLIVELPNAVDNPYFIGNNGHLIYDTSNTHNGS